MWIPFETKIFCMSYALGTQESRLLSRNTKALGLIWALHQVILDGIPTEALTHRLGNRSALEWVIDQYRVKTNPRSGIVNDPNRADDPEYILRLIGQVISVSLETVAIVAGLPGLGVEEEGPKTEELC